MYQESSEKGANKHPLSFAHLSFFFSWERFFDVILLLHFFILCYFCGQNNGIFQWKEKWNYLLLYAPSKNNNKKEKVVHYSLSLLHFEIMCINATCQKFPSISSHHTVRMFNFFSNDHDQKPFLSSHAKSREGVFSGNYKTCCFQKEVKRIFFVSL